MCATSHSLRSHSPRTLWTVQTRDTSPLSTSHWSLTSTQRNRSPVAPAEAVEKGPPRARARASQRARARGRTSQRRAKARERVRVRMSPRARVKGREKVRERMTSPKAKERARARERARTMTSQRARGRARAARRERRVLARRAGTTTMIPTHHQARASLVASLAASLVASLVANPRASQSLMMIGATTATRAARARVERAREAARAGTTEVLPSRSHLTLSSGRGLNFLISCRHPDIGCTR
mmetsp:Transcript_18113/g.42024  ORF Transcript_18113/g.42024 Transcript_18113/m.42024 type:complete len:242 (+) Transcript_18113:389-1114(+)